MRAIVALERPATSAKLRVVHCVACPGGPSSVRVITSTIRSSVALRGAPGRGSSVKPSSRRTRKRSRHLQTQLLETCSHLLQHGPPLPEKEVPTLETFAPRFVDGHARANRQKPSGIAATE